MNQLNMSETRQSFALDQELEERRTLERTEHLMQTWLYA